MACLALLPLASFFFIAPPVSQRHAAIEQNAVPRGSSSAFKADVPSDIDARSETHRSDLPSAALAKGTPARQVVPNSHPAVASHETTTARLPQIVLPWLVLVWATGVAAISLWNFGGWIALHRLKKMCTRPAPEFLRQAAERFRKYLAISAPVRVLESATVYSPMVIGILRPVVLIPASILSELSVDQLESLLAHELAHIRRHDYLANLLQSVIETLLFYHPVVWWISSVIRAERENCCDDIALEVAGDRASYANALAAIASAAAPALAPAATGGLLLARIRRVLALPELDSARAPRWIAGAAGLALVAAAAIPLLMPPTARAKSEQAAISTTRPSTAPTSRPVTSTNADELTLTFVGADSKPLGGASVTVAGSGALIIVTNGELKSHGSAIETVLTDKGGQARIRRLADKQSRVLALHPSGYALLDSSQIGTSPTIHIPAWAAIEGTAMIGTKSAAGKRVGLFTFPILHQDHNNSIEFNSAAVVDASGHFRIERVPPGKVNVGIEQTMREGPFTSVGYPQSVPVTVGPGEVAQVTIGGKGRPVIGHILTPPGVGQSIDWAYARTNLSNKSFPRRTPGVEQMIISIPVGADGSFRVEDVSAGEYKIEVKAMPSFIRDDPNNNYFSRGDEVIADASMPFTIPPMPEGRSDEPFDVGAIQLASKPQAHSDPEIDHGPQEQFAGTVQTPDGTPAANATVLLCPSGLEFFATVKNGQLLAWAPSLRRIVTDAQGRFHFSVAHGNYTCLITHPTGSYQANAELPKPDQIISLKAWSRISGHVYSGDKPIGDVQVLATRPQYSTTTVSHADGSFLLDFVPGGAEVSVSNRIEVPSPNRSSSRANLTRVMVEPGQTKEVNLGGGGRAVFGRVILPPERPGRSLRIESLIIPDVVHGGDGIPTSWFDMSPDARRSWYTNHWNGSLEADRSYPVVFKSDGRFRAEGLPVGNFVLIVEAYDAQLTRDQLMSFAYAFEITSAARTDQPLEFPVFKSDGTFKATPPENKSRAPGPQAFVQPTVDSILQPPLKYRIYEEKIKHEKAVKSATEAVERVRTLVLEAVERAVAVERRNPAPSEIAQARIEVTTLGRLLIDTKESLKNEVQAAAEFDARKPPFIGVFGSVARPGIFTLPKGAGVLKAVLDAGVDLNDPAYTMITITHFDEVGNHPKSAAFSLADLKRGNAPDVTLSPNDIIDVQRPAAGKWGH
jgi:beta-lactamase regulating signal transducer with metallopeptidase domain